MNENHTYTMCNHSWLVKSSYIKFAKLKSNKNQTKVSSSRHFKYIVNKIKNWGGKYIFKIYSKALHIPLFYSQYGSSNYIITRLSKNKKKPWNLQAT